MVLLRGESERESSDWTDMASVSESRLSLLSAIDSLCKPKCSCELLLGRLEVSLVGERRILLGWVDADARVRLDVSD